MTRYDLPDHADREGVPESDLRNALAVALLDVDGDALRNMDRAWSFADAILAAEPRLSLEAGTGLRKAREWLAWWDAGGSHEPDAAIEAVDLLRAALEGSDK